MLFDVQLKLWGTFSASFHDGADATPHLLKCQALLALLACASDGRRSRSWLQARLWSDRSKTQANGSLRQALSVTRKSLGAAGDCLISDRKVVALDMDRVHLAPRDAGEEFMAGFDLADEGFNDWLRQERSSRTPDAPHATVGSTALLNAPLVQPSLGTDPTIILTGSGTAEPLLGPIETFLIDSAARHLRESYAIHVHTVDLPDQAGRTINISLSAQQTGMDTLVLRAQCTDRKSSELIWSGHQIVAAHGAALFEDLNVLAWVNDLVAALSENLRCRALRSSEQQSATTLGLTALRELFSMRPDRVLAADGLLEQAHQIDQRGIFQAWRAQLRAIQLVERHTTTPEALREEGLEMAREALMADPMNSSVLGASASARLILDPDLLACDELSRQSMQANASNPIAALSRAFVLLYSDRLDASLKASEWASALSRGSPHRFFWDLQLAMACCTTGQVDKAIVAAERCAVFGPDCRPPMRYLVGLYASKGKVDRAVHWAQKLKALEPDFEVTRLVNDPTYPSSLLRRHALVSLDDLTPVAERLQA